MVVSLTILKLHIFNLGVDPPSEFLANFKVTFYFQIKCKLKCVSFGFLAVLENLHIFDVSNLVSGNFTAMRRCCLKYPVTFYWLLIKACVQSLYCWT